MKASNVLLLFFSLTVLVVILLCGILGVGGYSRVPVTSTQLSEIRLSISEFCLHDKRLCDVEKGKDITFYTTESATINKLINLFYFAYSGSADEDDGLPIVNLSAPLFESRSELDVVLYHELIHVLITDFTLTNDYEGMLGCLDHNKVKLATLDFFEKISFEDKTLYKEHLKVARYGLGNQLDDCSV